MRSYVIDELVAEDIKKISDSLKEKGFHSPLKDIFWIEVPENLLTSIQRDHLSSCGPYVFSLELVKNWLKLELLVRPTGRIRCSCISYATDAQRNYIINLIEQLYSSILENSK